MSSAPGRFRQPDIARIAVIALLIALALAGCEGDATPLPVALDTPTPTTPPILPASALRVGVDGRLLTLLSETTITTWVGGYEPVADVAALADGASDAYDAALALAPFPGSVALDASLDYLLAETSQPPLDTPEVRAFLDALLQPDAVRAAFGLCAEDCIPPAPLSIDALANAGYPDGIILWLATPFDSRPLADALVSIAAPAGVTLRLLDVADANAPSAHLFLFRRGTVLPDNLPVADAGLWLHLALYAHGDAAWIQALNAAVTGTPDA